MWGAFIGSWALNRENVVQCRSPEWEFLPRQYETASVEKLSISVERDLAGQARAAAKSQGTSLSSYVAEAVARRLRLDEGRRLLAEWQAEHGPITAGERQAARRAWPA